MTLNEPDEDYFINILCPLNVIFTFIYKQREGHNTLIDECVEHKHSPDQLIYSDKRITWTNNLNINFGVHSFIQDIDNIRTLSANIKIICTRFKNRNKNQAFASFSFCFEASTVKPALVTTSIQQ